MFLFSEVFVRLCCGCPRAPGHKLFNRDGGLKNDRLKKERGVKADMALLQYWVRGGLLCLSCSLRRDSTSIGNTTYVL